MLRKWKSNEAMSSSKNITTQIIAMQEPPWYSSTLATSCKQLTHGKDPDAGRDWGQEEKGRTEDEMVGCGHWLNA